MAGRMVARTALLGMLALGGSVVRAGVPGRDQPVRSSSKDHDGQIRAGRRPVAVIGLTNDQAVRDLAIKLLDLLASHTELAPPAISDGAALVDKLPAVEELRIAEAQKKRHAAETNLAQRNFREAAIDAVEGQELLLHVT